MGLNIVFAVVKGIAVRVFKGAVVDTAKVIVAKPVAAVVDAAKDVMVENVDSPHGGEGKVDWVRLISTISTILFAGLHFAGYITIEQLKQVAELLVTLI